jgi:uncharacterized protein YndB with AHSA1/START domain
LQKAVVTMELGSIEREVLVEASPEVVYEVITSPDHIRSWWAGAETDVVATAGATSELVWGDRSSPEAHVARLTVVQADPPRLFAFRWDYPEGSTPSAENSLLVTFELVPRGEGTILRLTESGWREVGWEVATLEAKYQDHVLGWDTHLGSLRAYVTDLVATP